MIEEAAAPSASARITSPLARSPRLHCRQHIEPDLAKMAIGGHHGRQLQLAHNGDARTLRERQVLVAVLAEEIPRPFETLGFDALPSQPSAPVDLLPPRVRGSETQAKSNQRQ